MQCEILLTARDSIDYPGTMLIRWLTILVLPGFILVHSYTIPTSHKGHQQWTGSAVDSANNNTRREELHVTSFNAGIAEVSIETQKVPVHLSHQEAIDHGRKAGRGVSFEKKDRWKEAGTIAALSKIASVRVAKEDSLIIARRLRETKDNAARGRFTHLRNNDNSAGNTTEYTKMTPPNTSLQLSPNDIFNRASNDNVMQRSVRCQVKGDIYIADIDENVPSYTCKFGNIIFLLASKRFRCDRRNSLDLSIDDDALRRLMNVTFTSTESRRHIIEVVLALKPDGENYQVRNQT